MENEGGPQFEMPPQAAEIPRQPTEEKEVSAAESGVGKSAPQPGSTAAVDITQLPSAPTPAVPITDQTATTAPASPATVDLTAHNTDRIEKEWVARTKSIVNQTRDDPHRQKSEMSKVKADYIHKRFNKIIKTDEATA